jgi:hypothetical protein
MNNLKTIDELETIDELKQNQIHPRHETKYLFIDQFGMFV